MVGNIPPRISVIMGIYNCSDTLEDAVKCIIDQTYPYWELIMCDDASTDRTYDVALEIALKDCRIKVLRNSENMTLAPTLNRCLAIAQGEYIARMDGDDFCSVDRFEKEISFLDSHPEYAFVSCNMDLADTSGVFNTIKYIEKPELKDFIHCNMHCHAAVMIRSDALKKVHGYSESIQRRRVEDYDLWVRLYKEGYCGYNIQESLYTMIDNVGAYKRRSLQNRINESRVVFFACKNAKSHVSGYFYCLLPLIKWMTPSSVYYLKHKHKKTGE